jgi:hypothetical protein
VKFPVLSMAGTQVLGMTISVGLSVDRLLPSAVAAVQHGASAITSAEYSAGLLRVPLTRWVQPLVASVRTRLNVLGAVPAQLLLVMTEFWAPPFVTPPLCPPPGIACGC